MLLMCCVLLSNPASKYIRTTAVNDTHYFSAIFYVLLWISTNVLDVEAFFPYCGGFRFFFLS